MSGYVTIMKSESIKAGGVMGERPMQTFIETIPLAKEKLLAA